jgi:phosphoglycolate phosphatase
VEVSTIKKNLMILWDIDGTLISLPKNSSRRHLDVIQKFTNKKLSEPLSNNGKTDIGLIIDIFEFNRIDFSFSDVQSCLYLLNLKSSKENYESTIFINPGINEALDYCSQIGVTNSILTGNTKSRAIDKLRSTKLISKISIDLGFFGDFELSRQELVQKAKNFAENSNWEKIILVGDTLLDVEAANKNNMDIIAVATGNVSYDKLKAENPNFIIRNFSEDFSYFKKIIKEYI